MKGGFRDAESGSASRAKGGTFLNLHRASQERVEIINNRSGGGWRGLLSSCYGLSTEVH